MSVVLPTPFVPISAARSPGDTLNETSKKSASPPGWAYSRSETTIEHIALAAAEQADAALALLRRRAWRLRDRAAVEDRARHLLAQPLGLVEQARQLRVGLLELGAHAWRPARRVVGVGGDVVHQAVRDHLEGKALDGRA